MSRNFELLHEAGKVQEMLRQRLEESTAAADVFVPGTPTLSMDGMAEAEITKLVHRLFLAPGSPSRQIVFAGAESGNGCSWIVARAADILATQVPGSVCLVDCDLNSPALHAHYQVSNHCGLAEALLENAPIRQFAQQLSHPNLWLLSAGSPNEQSQQLLTREKMRSRMLELHEQFDFVLLDVAPLDCGDHAIRVANWCDGLALVLKANSSSRKAAREMLDRVRRANVPVLGAVLNQRTFPIPQSIYSRL